MLGWCNKVIFMAFFLCERDIYSPVTRVICFPSLLSFIHRGSDTVIHTLLYITVYYRCALLSATSFCFWQSAGALFWAFLKCYLHPLWTSALFFNTACTFWYLQRKRVILLCSRRIHWSTGQLNQMNVKRGKGLKYFILIHLKIFLIWGLLLSTEK